MYVLCMPFVCMPVNSSQSFDCCIPHLAWVYSWWSLYGSAIYLFLLNIYIYIYIYIYIWTAFAGKSVGKKMIQN